jgi:hypothetical protein
MHRSAINPGTVPGSLGRRSTSARALARAPRRVRSLAAARGHGAPPGVGTGVPSLMQSSRAA